MLQHDHLQLSPPAEAYPEELQRAVDYATRLHEGQKRKLSGQDFIQHPLGVLALLPADARMATRQGAVLHDTVECGKSTIVEIRHRFGDETAQVVRGVTKDSSIADRQACMRSYLHYLRHKALPGSVDVGVADKYDNIADLVKQYPEWGDAMFAQFSTPPDQMLWWYEQVLAIGRSRLPERSLNDQLEEQIELFRPIVLGHRATAATVITL